MAARLETSLWPMVLFGAARVVDDGDVAGDHVREISQEPQREHFVRYIFSPAGKIERATGHAAAVDAFQFGQIAVDHFGAENYAEAIGVDTAGLYASFSQCKIGGGETELNFARHYLQAFARADVGFGIEIGHLGRDSHAKLAGVEQRDRPHAAHAFP